ncbi:hypothetical protein VP121E341_P0021 [Vibrio phage 121E34-1]|nr:hypothetical protein VP121E341_P0021 [Vibrio phage 121E34-1]CAH9011769.1 hypothetical protein VP131E341_P0021 [Vibrio phage 131E34-1]
MKDMKPLELKEKVTSVHAVEIKGGFRVEIEIKGGDRVVIKKKSTRAPKMVQLFDFWINGNSSGGAGAYFTFAQSVDSSYKENHLKGYLVVVDG